MSTYDHIYLFWFSLPVLPAVVGALEDLLVVALVAVSGGDVVEGCHPVFLGRGFGIPLLGDVVNLRRVMVAAILHVLKHFLETP